VADAIFKSVSTVVNSTTDTIVSSAAPSAASGDYLFMAVSNVGATQSPNSGLTGWTLLGTSTFYFGSGRVMFYGKFYSGDGTDAPTLTLVSPPSTGWQVYIACFEDVNPTTPVQVGAVTTDDTAPIVHAGLTSANAGSLALVAGYSTLEETGTYTFDNGFTQRLGTTSGRAAYLATKAVGSGAIGDTSVTNSTTLIRCGMYTAILNPTSGGDIVTVGENLTQANTLTTGAVTQTHQLSGGALSLNGTLTAGATVQTHQLAGANATQAGSISAGAVVQTHTTAGANLTQANSLTSAPAVQTHTLAAANLTQQNSLGTGQVSLIPTVIGAELTQQNSLSTGAVSQTHVVQGAALTQTRTLSSAPVIQTHVLAGSNLAQQSTLSTGVVSQTPTVVTVGANLTQQNALASVAVVQTHALAALNLSLVSSLSSGAASTGEVIHNVEGANLLQQNTISIRNYYKPNKARTVIVSGDNRRVSV
jgi:hypothetical protein